MDGKLIKSGNYPKKKKYERKYSDNEPMKWKIQDPETIRLSYAMGDNMQPPHPSEVPKPIFIKEGK